MNNKHYLFRIIVPFLSIVICIILFEIILSYYFPYNIATIGHLKSENSEKYGWGFNPGEIINILDPDTGDTYSARANNRGWRDRDRTWENPNNSFRILILGDSVTFGAIVPAEKVYTRILEDRLISEGYNIEVINISYGGWGTDQEYEALKLEGLLYKPNIIILQFCTNDLSDNISFLKYANGVSKPFYYSTNQNGELVRYKNTNFVINEYNKRLLKNIIASSEMLKRIYGIYLKLKFSPRYEFAIDANKIFKIKESFNLKEDNSFLLFLKENTGENISDHKLIAKINQCHLNSHHEQIMRILEKRWFDKYWSIANYYPDIQDSNKLEWQLFFKIVLAMNELAKKNNAKLAIYVDPEKGLYEWCRYWFRVSGDEKSKSNFLSYYRIIKDFSSHNGIYCVENLEKVKRARNDSHPNMAGNEAIAQNIYLFLMKYYKDGLQKYKH